MSKKNIRTFWYFPAFTHQQDFLFDYSTDKNGLFSPIPGVIKKNAFHTNTSEINKFQNDHHNVNVSSIYTPLVLYGPTTTYYWFIWYNKYFVVKKI